MRTALARFPVKTLSLPRDAVSDENGPEEAHVDDPDAERDGDGEVPAQPDWTPRTRQPIPSLFTIVLVVMGIKSSLDV
eukprot:1324524-Pyramimonas_sp.AAC.2